MPRLAALMLAFARGVGAPPGRLAPTAGVAGGWGVARPW